MGYQDRDYFRDEHSPYLDLIRSTRVCWGIVITLAVGYLLCAFTQDNAQPLGDYLQLNPHAMVKEWQWQRLLTAVFTCDNPWHLVYALFIIWLIGHELEQMVGGLELLVFFVIATLLSNLALTLFYYYVGDFPHAIPESFGPIGGAMALLTWAVMLSPHRVVTYLFVPMPFWIVGILVLVIDLFFFMQQVPMAVRLTVHCVSIPFAVLYNVFNWRLTGWNRWSMLHRRPARKQLTPVLQLPQRNLSARDENRLSEVATPIRAVDEQLEAKVDAILEKVSVSGMQSLSEEEKTTLKRASEVMKRRKK